MLLLVQNHTEHVCWNYVGYVTSTHLRPYWISANPWFPRDFSQSECGLWVTWLPPPADGLWQMWDGFEWYFSEEEEISFICYFVYLWPVETINRSTFALFMAGICIFQKCFSRALRSIEWGCSGVGILRWCLKSLHWSEWRLSTI